MIALKVVSNVLLFIGIVAKPMKGRLLSIVRHPQICVSCEQRRRHLSPPPGRRGIRTVMTEVGGRHCSHA